MPERSSAALRERQARFRAFLLDMERSRKIFTREDIARATGWTPTTVSAYLSKGHWDSFLVPQPGGGYKAEGVKVLSETEFSQSLTQSSRSRELGAWCKHHLSRALLAKSRDNMTLALELFNRPTTTNRLDAFVILYVVAWEQLLKAIIVEKDGENAVFRSHKPGKTRETIGLRECIATAWSFSESARRNLETVQRLRDEAIHLLVPETAGILSHLFQAGVLNYARAFAGFARTPFLPRDSMGLLTLVGDLKEISVVGLVRHYGESIGGDISSLVTELKREIAAVQNPDYAVPLDLRLTFSRSEAVGDIHLIKATEAPEGGVGYVVEKPVDLDRSHPHLTKEIVPLIDKALRDALQPHEVQSRLRGGEHKQRPGTFTTNDFQAVLAKEGWRESNNEFHHKLKKPETHRYSQSLVREVVKLIELDPTYLTRALESYRNRRK